MRIKQIDYRLLGITGGIVVIALTVSWLGIVLLRYLFPALAAETFLDELSSLPIAAMVTVGGQWLLLREAIITERTTLIRNISWWGVHGVDVCRLCFYVGDFDTPGYLLDLPRGLVHAHATINIKLSELNEQQQLIISPKHIE